MKKVLITGGAGFIGKKVVSYLLSESKYDITILELENKENIKYLKKYNNRVNIVYGDINDYNKISFLVRNQDIIIHLAGIMPLISEYNNNLHTILNIDGSMNLINAIKKQNPNCHLIYLSTTSLYEQSLKEINVKSKLSKEFKCNYVSDALNIENEMKKNLKNYTIFRSSLVLGDENFINILNTLNPKYNVEVISLNDVSYALSKSLEYLKELNKKTFNLSGGKNCQTTYNEIKRNIYLNYGISFKRFTGKLISKKCLNSFYIKDSDKLNDILHFQNDNLSTIYNNIKEKYPKRKMQKFIGKIILKVEKCLKR